MKSQDGNAGNQGDLIKHVALGSIIDRIADNAGTEFWYVETHTASPFYFLNDEKGKWQTGVGSAANDHTAPRIVKDYVSTAFHDLSNLPASFPDKRVFLGSSAQAFHRLKSRGKQVRMTLFELRSAPADELRDYFARQGALVISLNCVDSTEWSSSFIRSIWDEAVKSAGKTDVVIVVQGNSYQLAPALCSSRQGRRPDLVLVDPFALGDSRGEPKRLLASLTTHGVPFLCWTPLFRVPKSGGGPWSASRWSFECHRSIAGDKGAQDFVRESLNSSYDIAWCSWQGSYGARQEMYGCQLTSRGVFSDKFTPASIWEYPGKMVPYLDVEGRHSASPQDGLEHPSTSWQQAGQPIGIGADQADDQNRPGLLWWDKYHMAFWWPSKSQREPTH